MIDKFNIRVYGLLLDENKILVSTENIDGFQMLKFPGGGLEFGEGIKDCLIREFKEELDLDILIYEQIYITDHFIQSAFRKDEQVIAIYFWIDTYQDIKNYNTVQDTRVGSSNQIQFEWRDLDSSLISKLTFDTDKTAFARFMAKVNKVD